jgi:hypothetical protein
MPLLKLKALQILKNNLNMDNLKIIIGIQSKLNKIKLIKIRRKRFVVLNGNTLKKKDLKHNLMMIHLNFFFQEHRKISYKKLIPLKKITNRNKKIKINLRVFSNQKLLKVILIKYIIRLIPV